MEGGVSYGDSRLPLRFWKKVVVDPLTGCWLWQAGLRGKYSAYYHEGKCTYGHRAAYRALVGEIPSGLQIDHLCRVTRCVNPQHMETVTSRQNTLRSDNPFSKVWDSNCCLQGHEFTPANTYWNKGRRYCRPCDARRRREYRRRKRQ